MSARQWAMAAALMLAASSSQPADAQPAANKASEKAVAAAKVFPYLDAYYKLPPAERSLFTVGYYLRQSGAPAPRVRATIETASGRHALTVGPDGRILPLPTSTEFKAATVDFEAPPGPELGISVKPVSSLRAAEQMNAADVARSVAQASAGMKKAAGMKAFLLPALTRAVFVDAGSGTVVGADGRSSPLPGGDRPYYEPASQKGAVTLRFTHMPSSVLLHSSDAKR